ncbi:MAG: T9SS type A sorting domain-containing protein [Ginsengibacter sp.]
MKKLFTLISALLFFLIVEGQPKKPLEIEVFRLGEAHSMEFTSNRFNAININSDGVVWAGTIYEGLYRLDTKSTDPNNNWKKSTVAPNLFINDIKADRFGGIWVAQSGNKSPGGSHIEGGVNHIPDARRDSTVFYSMSGTQTEGYLYSRNVISLVITDSNRTFPTGNVGSLIFAAQGKSKSGGDIIRGGLNMSPFGTIYTPKFTRIAGRPFVPIAGFSSYEPSGWDWRRLSPASQDQLSRPYAECSGGNSTNEIWVAVRDNYDMTEIVRYSPDGQPKGKEASYNQTNSPLSQFSQPRAILFDSEGNKWLTTRYDGLMVLQAGSWTQKKLKNLLPEGGPIIEFNRNAIAEDEWGNVYFGTNAGLVVYKRFANFQQLGPTNDLSYELYTTEDGLPGNNITGLAYDKINGKILITVDGGGVAFVNVKPDHIEGMVLDVYTDIIKKDATPTPGFKTIPISDRATVKLFDNLEEVESIKPDNNGFFQFSKEKEGKSYRVEVEFTNRDWKTMKYIYTDVRSRSKVPPSYFPDSLIRELKLFKDSMETRYYNYKVLSIIPVTSKFKGFYVNNYNDPFNQFFDASGIKEDHAKKVYNLGIYLANLKTVYDLGGNATELAIEGMDNGWAVLKVLKGMYDFSKKLKEWEKLDNHPTSIEVQEAQIKMALLSIQTLRDMFLYMLDFSSKLLTLSPEVQPLAQAAYDGVNGAFDFVIELINKKVAFKFGNVNDVMENIIDLYSKIISTEIGGFCYRTVYARGIHSQFVPLASAGSVESKSDLTYTAANGALVSPYGESLLKQGKESLDSYKQIVADLNTLAKWSDRVDQLAQLTMALGAIPIGAPLAVIAVGVSKTAKITQFGALGSAMAVDYLGVIPQISLSKKTLNKSGINGLEASYLERREKRSIRRDPLPPSQHQPVKLRESKNKYNEMLTAFQATIGASGFTNEDYLNSINNLMEADSIYMRETRLAFKNLMASADSAIVYIPEFGNLIDNMMDSFVNKQSNYKYALFLNQYAVLNDLDNKANYLPAFDSTANELKILNDSTYNKFVRIIDLINQNGIGAPAYLSQTDYVLDHEFVPGTPGTFTNTYTNYGAEEMRKVSFKINEPTEGFNITSPDSIYVGNIAPGASVQVSFNFSSPSLTDTITIGRYEIDIKADNGKYSNTTGSLMIIQQGALPVTLINFEAKCSGSNTELSWETVLESNSSHFEIEKSMNGADWIVLGKLTSAGNSSIRSRYKLVDQLSKNSFYSLKQVDKDGKFTYSNILRSKCGIERPMISVYPIPAKNILNVAINVSENSTAQVLLIDLTGRVVQRFNSNLKNGINHLQLNLKGMAAGQYILSVKGSKISKTQKVTIGL